MPVLMMLWQNKRLILEILCCAVIGFLIWHFGFNIPNQLKKAKAEVGEWQKKAEVAENTVLLMTEIQKGKVIIDAKTQSQISTVRAKAIPRKSVIIQSGRVLPSLPNIPATSH